jgi:prepilin-type N-terminal cleavage/methylation domain-containing protein
MAPSCCQKGFSLIELLVALAVLAVVAAITIPKFLNVQQQAQFTVNTQQLTEIEDARNRWISLGGQLATSPDQNAAYRLLEFLNTPGDGIDLQRGFENNPSNPNPGHPNPLYPTDSAGSMGSWTISLSNIPLGGSTAGTPKAPTLSSPDGFYGSPPGPGSYTGGVPASIIRLFEKQGSQVTGIQDPNDNSDLATAIFLQTGATVTLTR